VKRFFILWAEIAAAMIAGAAAPTTGVDFIRDIEPILARNCHECHGEKKQKSGLRLDRPTDALRGGDLGKPAIVPGDSSASEMVRRIQTTHHEERMPPEGDHLSDSQVALLKKWIDGGAPWPIADRRFGETFHWSFVPPRRLPLPQVKNERWVRNPIDNFILSRLEKEKITPSPEAERSTLARRLSFDLVGLPPKLEEVGRFLNDRSPDAYEKLVDRLLASPHYGERWGRHWLDLARYADSDGYEKDGVRPFAHLYRDWVIDALNRDLAFDRFTTEQLAGDLLPDSAQQEKIATGFHRQTLTNKEGGVDQEEFRCKATVDRVNTTSAVWLGLTLGCAECHSHKYDPISQREFYEFYAFFNNASEREIPAPRADELADYETKKGQWEKENTELERALDELSTKDFSVAQAEWEKSLLPPVTRWKILRPEELVSLNGAELKLQADGSIAVNGNEAAIDRYSLVCRGDFSSVTGFRIEALDDPETKKGPGRRKNGNFVLTAFRVEAVDSDGTSRPVSLTNAAADFAQKDFPPASSLDDDPGTGWAIMPQTDRRHVAIFETTRDLTLGAGESLRLVLDQQYGEGHTLARFRLSTAISSRPLSFSTLRDSLAEIVNTPASKRDEPQRAELAQYYRQSVNPDARMLKEKLAAHAKKQPRLPETKAAVLAEEENGRDTRIHIRGDFLRRGQSVQPGTLSVLHPFKAAKARPDRLDLARWLFDSNNPLTSRVTVNRLWRHLFGRGLTATVDDFGARGERPSHPELLDWLATEFPRLHWSQKSLIRLIVTSATYRQASIHRPELMERDFSNILLARQNRFRLDAENVRDAYLDLSGLLNSKIGGPSIRPPLPSDIAAIGYANSVKWTESQGMERYRRGLYIFFQRTVPYPMLTTFDAPDSNVTCSRRERSNTPLQALTLMNDPVFFECAQALGQKLAGLPEADLKGRLRHSFQICLARSPTTQELSRLEQFYEGQRHLLEASAENAAKVVGERSSSRKSRTDMATAVALARTLLNLDEFVTRE
jgi:hypothetical protein